MLTPCPPASPSPFLQSYFSPVGVQPVQLHEVITSHVQNVTIQQMQFLLKPQGDWDTEMTRKTCVVKGHRRITHNDHLEQVGISRKLGFFNAEIRHRAAISELS